MIYMIEVDQESIKLILTQALCYTSVQALFLIVLCFYSNSFFITLFLLIFFDSYKKLEKFSGWRVSYKWVIFPSYCRLQLLICPFLIGGDYQLYQNTGSKIEFSWSEISVKQNFSSPLLKMRENIHYLLTSPSVEKRLPLLPNIRITLTATATWHKVFWTSLEEFSENVRF